jgi:type IV secretory pathway VirB2 component (pilin)
MMQKFAKYMTILVVLIYSILGIMLLATEKFNALQKEVRIILGIILLLYAAYRLARFFSPKRQNDEEIDREESLEN